MIHERRLLALQCSASLNWKAAAATSCDIAENIPIEEFVVKLA